MVNTEGWRKAQCVLGGFCAMCIAGHFLLIGNLGTYMESYLMERGDYPPGSTWLIPGLVTCVFAAGQFGTVVGGYLDRTIGSHYTALIGLSLIMIGVTISCWTIQVSTVAVVATFGVVSSLGFGTAYGSPYSALNKHKFQNSSLVYGIVNSGFGGGAVVFNVVLSAFINPHNRAPDTVHSQGIYFSQDAILDRVPFSFLLLGAFYAVALPVAVWGLRPPPSPSPEVAGDDVILATVTSETEKSRLTDKTCSLHKRTTMDTTYQAIGSQETALQTVEKMDEKEGQGSSEGGGGEGGEGREGRGLSPRQLFGYPMFYVIWVIIFLSGFVNNAVIGQYKGMGLTHIQDDILLASMGTAGSLMSAVSRPLWGLLIDHTSFQTGIVVNFAMSCICLAFWRVALLWSTWLFYLLTVLLFASVSATAVIILVAVKGYFGEKHQVANLSVVWTALTTESCLLPVITSVTLAEHGWKGFVLLLALLAMAGMLLSLLLPKDLVLLNDVKGADDVTNSRWSGKAEKDQSGNGSGGQ